MNGLSKGKKVFLTVAALLSVTFFVSYYILGLRIYQIAGVYAVYLVLALIIFRPWLTAFLGNLYLVTGKTEKSRQWLLKAFAANTKSPAAYLNYAIIQLREGDAQNAMANLQKAKELDPKTSLDKNITLTIGSCYYVLGQIDDAVKVLEDLRGRYMYVNAHVLSTLGYMYFLKGNDSKALEITGAALEDSPQLGSAWDNLGQIYYRRNDAGEAKKAFLNAVNYKNDLVDSYYYLGVIEEEAGSAENAKLYFEKCRNCKITALNTVNSGDVDEKCKKYGIF